MKIKKRDENYIQTNEKENEKRDKWEQQNQKGKENQQTQNKEYEDRQQQHINERGKHK